MGGKVGKGGVDLKLVYILRHFLASPSALVFFECYIKKYIDMK